MNMETKDRIKELLEIGATQRQVAKKLNLSEATISYYVKKYQKEWSLSSIRSSSKFFSKSTLIPDIGYQASNQAPLAMRLHRHHRAYELAQANTLLEPIKTVKLNNNIQQFSKVFGITIRLTTSHMIIEGLELYAPLRAIAPELANEADRICNALAVWAELDNGLKLVKNANNDLIARTSIVEIEINEHDMATQIKEKGIIPLYWNRITGKVEVWTDKSGNLDNIEANVVLYLEKLRAFTQDIVEDRWSVKNQLEFNSQIMATLAYQNKFFEKHNKLIEDVDKLVNKMNKELSQRKLFE